MEDNLTKLYKWYYEPGEVLRSVGFYINPYKSFANASFRHVFAFDGDYNLYVAQYSVFQKHIDEVYDLKDKREYGFIYPIESPVCPDYIKKLNQVAPVVDFQFLEDRNIVYLNKRLRPIAQRIFDYGMPPETYIHSKKVDLWYLNIKTLLKEKYLERPPKKFFIEKKLTS